MLSVSLNKTFPFLSFPYLVLKLGHSLKPWNKLKIHLHPNILFLQTHFYVSKLYNIIKLEHPLIGMVIQKCFFYNFANKDIIFGWVTSHTVIRGNEKADSVAKSALDLLRVKVSVPYTDFKHHINQYILSTWQDDWSGAERRNCLVLCLHRSYLLDSFIHLEKLSSTSV